MTEMRLVLKMLVNCLWTGWIMRIKLILAIQVGGEHGMNDATMRMTHIPMMIYLGMNMNQWEHEHPRDQPEDAKEPDSPHA